MDNVTVGRYETPAAGYVGWIEPASRLWIMFVRESNVPEVYLDRDPVTGAVR